MNEFGVFALTPDKSKGYITSLNSFLIYPGKTIQIFLKSVFKPEKIVCILPDYDLSLKKNIFLLNHNFNEDEDSKWILLQNNSPLEPANAFNGFFGPRDKCEIRRGELIARVFLHNK